MVPIFILPLMPDRHLKLLGLTGAAGIRLAGNLRLKPGDGRGSARQMLSLLCGVGLGEGRIQFGQHLPCLDDIAGVHIDLPHDRPVQRLHIERALRRHQPAG